MADWHTRNACQSLRSWGALDEHRVDLNRRRKVSINVGEPWFEHIVKGKKDVEGRLNRGKFAELERGNQLFINDGAIVAKIVRVTPYLSFEEYLRIEGLKRTLPGISTIEEGIAAYRQFYSEEDEHLYGVVAIELEI